MDKQLQALQRNFEDAVQRTDAEGVEFWFARDLQEPLGGQNPIQNSALQTVLQQAEGCLPVGCSSSESAILRCRFNMELQPKCFCYFQHGAELRITF